MYLKQYWWLSFCSLNDSECDGEQGKKLSDPMWSRSRRTHDWYLKYLQVTPTAAPSVKTTDLFSKVRPMPELAEVTTLTGWVVSGRRLPWTLPLIQAWPHPQYDRVIYSHSNGTAVLRPARFTVLDMPLLIYLFIHWHPTFRVGVHLSSTWLRRRARSCR